MVNPVSPQLVITVHQEKVRDMERWIDLKREASARGATHSPAFSGWYPQAVQWVQARLLRRNPTTAPQARLEEPCPAPCWQPG